MRSFTTEIFEQKTTDRPQAYTVSAFIKAFGVGKTTVWAEIGAQRLRAVRCGRRVLIRAADAEMWAAALPSVTTRPKG